MFSAHSSLGPAGRVLLIVWFRDGSLHYDWLIRHFFSFWEVCRLRWTKLFGGLVAPGDGGSERAHTHTQKRPITSVSMVTAAWLLFRHWSQVSLGDESGVCVCVCGCVCAFVCGEIAFFLFLPRPSVQPTESLFSAPKDWIENRCGLWNATEAKRQMLPLYSHRQCGSSSSAGDWEHLRPHSGWIIVSLIFFVLLLSI